MADYQNTFQELDSLFEEIATSRKVAGAAIKKTTLDIVASQALTHALSSNGIVGSYASNPRIDDGEPPLAPSNVTVEALNHGLSISWDPPPSEERVKIARVKVTPAASGPILYDASTLINHQVSGLDPTKVHQVQVKFIDAFSAEGPYSAVISKTPLLSVAEEINLGLANILGELGYSNIEQLNDSTKLGDNVVTGRAMVVHDAVEFNLWAQNAMIQSAKIAEVVADKITTGTLLAATISLSSTGKIQAGEHTKLDSGGISLGLADSWDTSAAAGSFKVSSEDNSSALMFFDQTPDLNLLDDYRGAIVRGDGNSTGPSTGLPGAVVLAATRNGDLLDAESRAAVLVLASRPGFLGAVYTHGILQAQNGLRVQGSLLGNFNSAASSVTNGSFITATHTLDLVPQCVFVQASTDQVTWNQVTHSTQYAIEITDAQVKVTNNSGGTKWIRVRVIG